MNGATIRLQNRRAALVERLVKARALHAALEADLTTAALLQAERNSSASNAKYYSLQSRQVITADAILTLARAIKALDGMIGDASAADAASTVIDRMADAAIDRGPVH